MSYAGLFLFLLGIIFVIVAPINKRKNTRCSAEAQGMLCDIHRSVNSKGSRTTKYIYSYFVDGTEYQIKSTILSKEAHNIGENCTIWYDPKKPGKAQPFHYASAKVYNIIILIGVAMILLGLFLIVFALGHSGQ